jgi:hypothetical protein
MMRIGLAVLVFAIVFATAYGVIFSFVYPLVPLDGSLISLFALAGVATCLVFMGARKWWFGKGKQA